MSIASRLAKFAQFLVAKEWDGGETPPGDIGLTGIAEASELRAGTDNEKALTAKAAYDAMAEVTLTDAATIAIDLQAGTDFVVALGGNRTLGNPTNADKVIGKKGRIRILHSDRSLSFGSNWKFAGGEAPELSTGTGKTDILYYDVIAADFILGALVAEVE